MKVSQVLEKAANLLETKGWCRGMLAKNKHGDVTAFSLRYAVRWSVYGAILKVCKDEDNYYAVKAIEDHLNQPLEVWNDEQTDKRKVIRMLRRVARELK